jgi:hypothetical protein
MRWVRASFCRGRVISVLVRELGRFDALRKRHVQRARSSRSTRRRCGESRRLTEQLVQAGNQQATSFRPAFELALEGVIDTDTFKSIFATIRDTHESIIEQGDGGGRQGLDLGAVR